MTQVAMVEAAFKSQREFLVTASKSKKPSEKDLQSLLLPLSNKISEIQDFREKNRRSAYFNHLSAISESIPALGWVTVVSQLQQLLASMAKKNTIKNLGHRKLNCHY